MKKKIPSKERVHIKIIERLGKFLSEGNHIHEKFDFSTWNATPNSYTEGNRCGTNGCAIGNLPHLYPENFKWDGDNVIQLGGQVYGKKLSKSSSDFNSLLGLPDNLFEFLFIPQDKDNAHIPMNGLTEKATAQQVGKHLLDFVKDFKEGKWDAYFFMRRFV